MSDLIMMSHEVRDLVNRQLAPDERVLWAGQPVPGRLARRTLPIVFVGIAWTAVILFLMWAASTFWRILAVGVSVLAVPLLLIGLAMLLSPLLAVRKARRTTYVVTDRRAIVIAGFFSRSVECFGPGHLRTLRLDEDPDGSGDVAFAHSGFYGVDNVRQVEAMLKDVAAHADAPGESPYTEKETD
ncbi:MAG TPA: hypothetical protein VMZ92_12670 [Planctomycetota bacterium]|nr:hypothetical protein [Planctomycetota bacterium]